MKLQILSDIHTELYSPDNTPSVVSSDADLLVLAGDIGIGYDAATWVAGQADKLQIPVVYVLGNHEFSHHDFTTLTDDLRSWFAINATNVHVLENDRFIYRGVRFLGTALWTDYRAAEPEFSQKEVMDYAKNNWSDYREIAFNNRSFVPEDALQAHQESLAWLKHQLSVPFQGKTVVVTHHAPSNSCQRYRKPLDIESGCFQSRLDHLMGDNIDLWIFGHTHFNIDTEINGTRLVCNQSGPPHKLAAEFDPVKVIELKGA
jgi:predicted phosphodiesterase